MSITKTRQICSSHIEEFTKARVNESDLTEVLVETCAMSIPTKSQNH
jgi:hypothetical protein